MGKLINRISGSRQTSSLPGSALRTHVESLGKPRDVNKRSQSLVFSIYQSGSVMDKPILCSVECIKRYK